MSELRSAKESKTNQIKLERLALRSEEIDKNTGRIILPKLEELEKIKNDDTYVPNEPVQFQAPKRVVEKQSIPSGYGAQAMPTIPTKVKKAPVDKSRDEKPNISNLLGILGLVLGGLLLLSFLWIGYELQQIRLNQLNPVIQAQLETTDSEFGNAELVELLDLVESMYAEFPATINEVNSTVVDLQKEVESLEFEFVESESKLASDAEEESAEN